VSARDSAVASYVRSVRVAVATTPSRATRVLRDLPLADPERLKWTLPLAGILAYLVAFTSVRLPIGNLAMGLALLGVASAPRAFRLPAPLAMLGVFLIWVFAVSTRTEYPDWFAAHMLDLLKLWLIVLVAYNALRTRAQQRVFMLFFLACFALWPIRGTLVSYFVLHETDNEGRASWIQLYRNPNDLANMALLQLSMAAALLATERKRLARIAATAALMVLPLLILLTQSRGVFLGLLAFLAIVLTGQRKRLQLLVRLVAVVMIVVAVTPAGVWNRLDSLRRATSTEQLADVDGEQGSALLRYQIWRVAVRIISEHPITGVGFNAYKPAHLRYSASPEFDQHIHDLWDTHSLYLNVTAETGIPGLLLYLTYLVTVIVPADRVRRRIRAQLPDEARQILVLEAGAIGFMTACVFGSLAYLPHLHLHLALLYTLAMAHGERAAVPAPAKGRAWRSWAPARRPALPA
jgi:O-antigen ligase